MLAGREFVRGGSQVGRAPVLLKLIVHNKL